MGAFSRPANNRCERLGRLLPSNGLAPEDLLVLEQRSPAADRPERAGSRPDTSLGRFRIHASRCHNTPHFRSGGASDERIQIVYDDPLIQQRQSAAFLDGPHHEA